MSITLDVSNFLQNEISSETLDGTNGINIGSRHAARKMEELLHKELETISELPKDGSANIFDEIENFLKHNKFIDPNERDDHPQQAKHESKSTQVPQTEIVPELELSPTLHPIDISSSNLGSEQLSLPLSKLSVLNSSTHQSYIEPQLYSVELGRLHPITSPFLATGIYKKMTPTPETIRSPIKQNVFITILGDRGGVLSTAHFREQYMCAVAYDSPPEEIRNSTNAPAILEIPEELTGNSESVTDQGMPAVSMNCGIRVPKQWDALSKWAYDILKFSNRDQIIIDRQRNEIIRTHNTTKKKTVYRFLSPEDFGLKPQEKSSLVRLPQSREPPALTTGGPRTKFGRPPKRKAAEGSMPDGSKVKEPSGKHKEKYLDVKRSHKPTDLHEKTASENAVRTRFGRVVRTRIRSTDTRVHQNTGENPEEPLVQNSPEYIQNMLTDLKDSDYRCRKPTSLIDAVSFPKQENVTIPDSESNSTVKNSKTTKRKLPPGATCPTCNKIFLGRRMQRHFVQHPDHMLAATENQKTTAIETTTITPLPQSICQPQTIDQSTNGELSLFRFLVAKLQRVPFSEDQRADLFLNEIDDLVVQLQLRCSRLIRNTSGLHFVSSRCSRVLGIPEGHYALDMAAIINEAPPPIETVESTSAPCLLNFENISSSALPAAPLPNARTLEYATLSMSLDGTLTDEAAQKLNLSVGGKLLPPSEESLLRTVGDLVHDGLQKLQQESGVAVTAENLFNAPQSKPALVAVHVPPSIHYDHVNDNAVESANMKEIISEQEATPLIGLPVDFFQFNND